MQSETLSILIVDDSVVVRMGLKELITVQNEIATIRARFSAHESQ